MNASQLRRAWQLASAHGHEWAEALPQEDLDRRQWTVKTIEAATMLARRPGQMPGIAAPTVGMDGAISHQTVTGRLSWHVDLDGTVVLRVERPRGVVLVAWMRPDGRLEVHRHHPDVPLHRRHVEALRYALRALGWEGDLDGLVGPVEDD